jgi:hypothetical protein
MKKILLLFGTLFVLQPAFSQESPIDFGASSTVGFHDLFSTDNLGSIIGGIRVAVEGEFDVFLNPYFGTGLSAGFKSFPPFSIDGSDEINLFPEVNLRALVIARLGAIRLTGFAGALFGTQGPSQITDMASLFGLEEGFSYEFGGALTLGWLYAEYAILLPFDTNNIITQRYMGGFKVGIDSLFGNSVEEIEPDASNF